MASAPAGNVVSISAKKLADDLENEWFWSRKADFLDDIDPNETHPMLVKDLLPLGLAGVKHGGGGTGKSTANSQLFQRIAWWTPGDTWLGREIPEPRTGRVIVISKDETLKGIGKSMVRTGAQQRKYEWERKHGREDRFKAFGLDDFSETLFRMEGDNVVANDRWKRLMDIADQWKPDILNIDTIGAAAGIPIDSNNGAAVQYMGFMNQFAAVSGGCVMGDLHHAKHAQIRSIMEAANAAAGPSQFINSGRWAMTMYRAHKELAQAVVERKMAGADRLKNVIVVGLSKSNIDGTEGLEPYVFVRQPKDGMFVRDMVEVTDQIRALVGGDDLLEGIASHSSDKTARRSEAKPETTKERKAREKAEKAQVEDHARKVAEVCAETDMDPVAAAAWVDEQEGREPAKPKADRFAAQRAAYEERAKTDSKVADIMREHEVDAFAACRYADTGRTQYLKRWK